MEEREITNMFQKTRIAPSISPPPGRGRATSFTRNPSRSRSASTYRPPYYRQATAGGTEQGPFRYVHVGETITYPDDHEWGMGPPPTLREHTW